MKNVLILGGSGFVGRHVCEALNREGVRITVPTRRLPARSVQTLPMVTVLPADVHNPAQLTALVRGHDAVINLVAQLHGTEASFQRVHVDLLRTLAQACASTGVQRLIHISALGASSTAPSIYQRSKAHGEQVLLQAAQHSGLQTTLLQPSVIFGSDDQFINLFAKLQAVAPFVPLAGAHARFQPVWVEDVAKAVVFALMHPSSIGKTYELVGPDVFTLQQLVQWAGRWAGTPRAVWPLPNALAHVQAWLMEHLPGPTLMSRDNLESMKVDNVSQGLHPGLAALGVSQPQRLAAVFAVQS